MGTQNTVLVSYDNGALSVDTSTVTLFDPDDWVVWQSSSTTSPLPEGATLMVHFEQPFGVFSGVRGVTAQSVVAKGNSGTVDEFSYFLFLLRGTDHQDQLIKAGPFTIDNQCSQRNMSPWVQISFTATEPPDPREAIVAEPETLILHEGDPVFWEVSGVPEDYIVAFFFPDDSVIGPFSTYFMTPRNGAGPQRMGNGAFTSTAVVKTNYGIRVWDETGKLVGTKDPSIDGLGRPPGLPTT